jgi:thymidylate synthase
MQFFLRGETDTKKLGTKGVNYWKGNTSREFLDKRGLTYLEEGNMGKGYGWQFRNFGSITDFVTLENINGIDQLKELIKGLQKDPNGRRHIISLWNPKDLPETALPPCHLYSQFYCDPEKKELSCFFLMRSTDLFLGLPTNIIQYALLTHYLAKLLGYTAKELVYSGVDAHLYVNSLEALEIQSEREPYDLPQLVINKDLNSLDDILALEFTDIELKGYQSQKNIKVDMVV